MEVTRIVLLFSLKLECEKLVQEKTEMQRHYVMVRSFCDQQDLQANRIFE